MESEHIVNIIEDHAMMKHTIDAICCALENGTEMPNIIPVMNDVKVTDQLSMIAEELTKLRRKML